MSVIRIVPTELLEEGCSVCLEIQLLNFRNKIKEQWNQYNADGKFAIKDIKFTLDENLLWEEPITMINGSLLCITHMLRNIIMTIEQRESPGKPKLEAIQGDISSFIRK